MFQHSQFQMDPFAKAVRSVSWEEQALFGAGIYARLRKGQAGFGVKVISSRDFWVGSVLAHHRCGLRQKVGCASGCCLSRHVVLFLLGTVVFPLTERNLERRP